MVTDGTDINPTVGQSTGRDLSNLYLVARMFWCEDIARSDICWGATDPLFNFIQTAPMLLTRALLDRMRNNFMIIEVWDKRTTSAQNNDVLVGIVKLPLHQFYMSYRDRRICASLLRSQYPVSSVDGDVGVVNPFTGVQNGRLRVLLAMGSHEQITGLHRTRVVAGTERLVEAQSMTVEHMFEVGFNFFALRIV